MKISHTSCLPRAHSKSLNRERNERCPTSGLLTLCCWWQITERTMCWGSSDFSTICVMITEVLACSRWGSRHHCYWHWITGVWPGQEGQGEDRSTQGPSGLDINLHDLRFDAWGWAEQSMWACTSAELRQRPTATLPQRSLQLGAQGFLDRQRLCNKGAQALDSGCHGSGRLIL